MKKAIREFPSRQIPRQHPGQPSGQPHIDPDKANAFADAYNALCVAHGLAFVAEAGIESWPGQPPKPLARLKLVSIPLAEPNVGEPDEPPKPDGTNKPAPEPVPDATPGDPPEVTDESY